MERHMRRVVVLGGLGFFGRTAAGELRALGVDVRLASRGPGAELRIHAEDPDSIRSQLIRGDIVLDAAGPFHARTSTLIDSASEVGFDVVDLNDDVSYAETVLAREQQIAQAGIRVLSSASTVSAMSAAVLKMLDVEQPRRFTAFLAPATRRTANAGTAQSLLRTVGQPIRVLRSGALHTVTGWREQRTFAPNASHKLHKLLPIHGHVFESADAIWLPRACPSLQDVAMYVDANIPAANAILCLAARSTAVRSLLKRSIGVGAAVARRLGSSVGGVAYQVEANDGRIATFALFAEEKSYLLAVAPPVLAVKKLVNDQISDRGVLAPGQYTDAAEILEFLRAASVKFTTESD